MTWQSSPYDGDDSRIQPSNQGASSQRHSISGREIRVGGSPVAPASSHRLQMHNRDSQAYCSGPIQYQSHVQPPPHPPHRRVLYTGQPSHSLPPPPSKSYDRYYDYHSSYPPPHPRHYGTPRHYGDISPDHRASPPRDSYPSIPPGMDSFRSGGCTCKKSRCLKLYCQCFALSTTCGPKCKCQTCYNTTLHAEAIDEARKTILERNPSAFDDKFRGNVSTPSPYRGPPPPVTVYHHSSPPSVTWLPSAYNTPSATVPSIVPVASPNGSPPPPPRVNKFGCKCRRSFCLKKYCECYQNSVKCGLNCRCTNCRNYPHDGSGLPPPRPLPLVAPVSYGPSSPRCVSEDAGITTASVTPPADEAAKKAEREDRMAIMAAVAMTELFGSKQELPEEYKDRKAEKDSSEIQIAQEAEKETTTTPEVKRKPEKISIISSPEKSDNEQSTPPLKRARPDSYTDVGSSPIQESRNPSPVSVITPQTSYPRQFNQRLPPPSHHHLPPHYPHNPPHRRTYHQPPGPVTPYHARYDPPRPYHSYYQSPPQPRASSYEDVIKSSGLPKALSFRKICSKCGKTRGEHGELGFGNKCVFQECGKCGAGVQMHTKAGSPMGILCRLSVDEGATPGAATSYERKIRDLAARAELQKTMLEDKRERVERLAAQQPFVSTV